MLSLLKTLTREDSSLIRCNRMTNTQDLGQSKMEWDTSNQEWDINSQVWVTNSKETTIQLLLSTSTVDNNMTLIKEWDLSKTSITKGTSNKIKDTNNNSFRVISSRTNYLEAPPRMLTT